MRAALDMTGTFDAGGNTNDLQGLGDFLKRLERILELIEGHANCLQGFFVALRRLLDFTQEDAHPLDQQLQAGDMFGGALTDQLIGDSAGRRRDLVGPAVKTLQGFADLEKAVFGQRMQCNQTAAGRLQFLMPVMQLPDCLMRLTIIHMFKSCCHAPALRSSLTDCYEKMASTKPEICSGTNGLTIKAETPIARARSRHSSSVSPVSMIIGKC